MRDYQLNEKDLLFDLADYITAAPAADDDTQSLTAEEKKRLLNSMGSVVVETFSETAPKTVHNKAADLVKKVNKIRQETVDKDKSSTLVLGRRRHLMKNVNKNKKLRTSKNGTAPSRPVPTKPKEKPTVEPQAESQAVESKLRDLEKLESGESMESSYEDEEEEDEELSDFVRVDQKNMLGVDSSDEEWNDDINPGSRYWEAVCRHLTSSN